MNNTLKMTLAAAVALGATSFSTAAMAGASANIGVTSDYVWRGESQTSNKPAIQGGLDYEAANGFYIGTWMSNVEFAPPKTTQEVDVYLGYSGETAGGLGYDIGYNQYMYPKDTDADFGEVYLGLSYGAVEGGVAYTANSEVAAGNPYRKGDVYYHIGASKEIKPGLTLGGMVGSYEFDDAAATDYTHYQLSLSKDDFTFAVDDTDKSGVDPIYSVSWSKSFDL